MGLHRKSDESPRESVYECYNRTGGAAGCRAAAKRLEQQAGEETGKARGKL